MPKHFSSAYWRGRGEEVRALVAATDNEEFQSTLRDIADEYDKLAEFAEARERGPAPSQPHAAD